MLHRIIVLLVPVVQTLDSAIHLINLYPVDNEIGFPNTYLLDSDLSEGQRYHPTFEQPGPGGHRFVSSFCSEKETKLNVNLKTYGCCIFFILSRAKTFFFF